MRVAPDIDPGARRSSICAQRRMKHTVAPFGAEKRLACLAWGSRRPGCKCVLLQRSAQGEPKHGRAHGASGEKLEPILAGPKFSQSFLELNPAGLTGTSQVWPGPQNPESQMVS
jgi:hypothetical protein